MEGFLVFWIVCLSCLLRIVAGTAAEDKSSQFTWRQTVADAFNTEDRFYAIKITSINDEINHSKALKSELADNINALNKKYNEWKGKIAELLTKMGKMPIFTAGQDEEAGLKVAKMLQLLRNKCQLVARLESLPPLPREFEINAVIASIKELEQKLETAKKAFEESLNDIKGDFESSNHLHENLVDYVYFFYTIPESDKVEIIAEYKQYQTRIKDRFVQISFISDAVAEIRQEFEKLHDAIERYQIEQELAKTNEELKKYAKYEDLQVNTDYLDLHELIEGLLVEANNARKQMRQLKREIKNLDERFNLQIPELDVLKHQRRHVVFWANKIEEFSGAKSVPALEAENAYLLGEFKLHAIRMGGLQNEIEKLKHKIEDLTNQQYQVDEKKAELLEKDKLLKLKEKDLDERTKKLDQRTKNLDQRQSELERVFVALERGQKQFEATKRDSQNQQKMMNEVFAQEKKAFDEERKAFAQEKEELRQKAMQDAVRIAELYHQIQTMQDNAPIVTNC